MTRAEIKEFADENGIEIKIATTDRDAQLVAIHLLNPDEQDLENALDRATRDLFETIVIHNLFTWPN